MKEKFNWKYIIANKCNNILRIMKLSVFLLFLCFFSITAENIYPQQKELSFDLKNTTLGQAFSLIEKNSDYVFLVSDEAESFFNKKIDLAVKKESIGQVLSSLLENTDLGYAVVERQVFIYRKKAPKVTGKTEPAEEAPVNQPPPKKTITGAVKDINNLPVIGANVIETGTAGNGTATDVDGRFRLNVEENAVIRVSFIGYVDQEINTTGKNQFDIILHEDAESLDEVVVVAYGTQKKETIVGAISQVKGADLMRSGAASVGSTLAGRIPGMVTIHQTGMPGDSDPAIYIRGLSSFTGNNQPLVMVDGIERPLSNIDPSEVESISVLKDASATAVYGVKGGNGVILITTKRGQEGRMEISVTADATMKQSLTRSGQENSYNTLRARDEMYRNRGQFGNVLGPEILDRYLNRRNEWDQYIYPDIDAWNLSIRPISWDHRASISARGGTKSTKYFLMLGYLFEDDLFKTVQKEYDSRYTYNRVNFRMNFDFDLTSSTKFSVSSSGYVGTRNMGGQTTNLPQRYRDFFLTPPWLTPYVYPASFVKAYPSEKYPIVSDRLAVDPLQMNQFPGWVAYNYTGSTRTLSNRLTTDLVFNQKLDFITRGLSFMANFAYNNYSNYGGGGVNYNPELWLFTMVDDATNTYTWQRIINSASNDFDVIAPPEQRSMYRQTPSYDYVYGSRLTYNRNFETSHTVTGIALFERRISQSGASFPFYEEKWSGRMTYDYEGKYMLETTIGITGSARFAPANRFGYFPSIAVGWNISKEKFFQKLMPNQINNFKIRYSYGESGNDNVPGYLYLSEYTMTPLINNNYGAGLNLGGFGELQNLPATIKEGQVPNHNARWERAKKNNLGIDVGLTNSNGSINLSAELFSEHRDGILMNKNLIHSMLGQQTKQLNIGETKRHGFELELNYLGRYENWSWWASANYNFNENRTVKRDQSPYAPKYQNLEGKPISYLASQLNIGYYQNMDELMNYAPASNLSFIKAPGRDMILDFDGNGILDGNDAIPMKENSRPSTTYGWSGGFTFKQFEFSFLFQGVDNVSKQWGEYCNPMISINGEKWALMRERSDAWTPANRNSAYASWGQWNYGNKSILDAKYLRLKQLEFAYSVSGQMLKKIGFNSARIALQGYNLWTYAPGYIMGDPENEATGRGGFDNSLYTYPLPRRYTLAVKFDF